MQKTRLGRRAISSMISGLIVLALFLTVLGSLVALTHQYDTYQTSVNTMSQTDIDRFSESLQPVYPGLKGGFSAVGCSNCIQYNMSLANPGTIAAQIVRIYINSTQNSSGCTVTNTNYKSECVLGPVSSPTPFGFDTYDSYINVGEITHIVRMWLPANVVLPNMTLTPSNSVWIVTNRGRVFSFDWPFPPAGQGIPGAGSPPTLFTGTMWIAYNGTDISQSDACHKEATTKLPAGGASNFLYYLNPWVTSAVMSDVGAGSTTLYIAAYSANSLSVPITVDWGEMIILTSDSSSNAKVFFIGGPLVGVVYNQPRQFAAAGTPVTINPGYDFYLIYKITQLNPPPGGDTFSGTAAANNGYANQAEGGSFRELQVFLNGLYIRPVAAGCA